MPATNLKFIQAVGRRKTAVAQIRLYKNGTGKFVINNVAIEADKVLLKPIALCNKNNQLDVSVIVRGGGMYSQKQAIVHGLSRALVDIDPTCHITLRKVGFLTRDPRAKERKKPGLKRARRAPQWQKR